VERTLSNEHDAAGLTNERVETVSVQELLTTPLLDLNLEVVEGKEGLQNEIRSPLIQKLGLALAGVMGFIHPDRVQVVGGSELSYLRGLDSAERAAAFDRLKKHPICCIVVVKDLEIPLELLDLSSAGKTPVLRSSDIGSVTLAKMASYLEKRLAPQITIHGVLLQIFGLGVLILGPSGIGKSECALELILKGHRLISDDYVELTKHGMDRLTGEGGKTLEHHMELRGLGIINIKELFGISATGASQNIDFAVRLERWNPEAEYDRLGLDQSFINYLGVSIPVIDMPVAPGRNIATLVEVAARLHLLRRKKNHE
jgi:HPr kinase/phosphorylase